MLLSIVLGLMGIPCRRKTVNDNALRFVTLLDRVSTTGCEAGIVITGNVWEFTSAVVRSEYFSDNLRIFLRYTEGSMVLYQGSRRIRLTIIMTSGCQRVFLIHFGDSELISWVLRQVGRGAHYSACAFTISIDSIRVCSERHTTSTAVRIKYHCSRCAIFRFR